jgi:integrase
LSHIANSACNAGMPRPRPTHLVREFSRHGKAIWYCRRGGRRIRLRAEYGTPEFEAEFQAALHGGTKPEPQRDDRKPGTVAWLIARYRETTVWQQDLSAATRRQRDNIFLHVINNIGDLPVAAITREKVIEGRDKRFVKTPHQARNFLDALRGLFRWALDAGHIKVDPTAGVKNPKRKSGDGFAPWTEDDVLAYERRWPIDTRQRVWLDVLLYTGLRRGDAVRLGRQHVRDGVATLQTEKSQGAVTVSLPILPVLQRTLAAGPCGDLAFICAKTGGPLTKESFGNLFGEACREAGLKGKSAHGIRKIAATRAANSGATVAELEAIFGWRGGRMASLYTREADRRRLALGGMHKLASPANEKPTSIVAPMRKVRHPEAKDQ